MACAEETKRSREGRSGVSNPAYDDEHIDAACAWLNVEGSVMQEVAEREFGYDEVAIAVEVQAQTREFLVQGFGEEGERFFDEVTGGDLPDDLSEEDHARQLAQRIKESFGEATFGLACYLLASRWSLLGILREAGAGRETFEGVFRETFQRLGGLVGAKKAEHAWELTQEFMEAAGR